MERPFTLDHLDHVVLRVADLKKSLAFYSMLGADGQREVAAGTVMRIAQNPNQTLIFQERPDHESPNVEAIDHINLTIRAASIEHVGAYLRENGAEIIRGPEDGRAGPTVYVSDPDGYVLEIRIARDA